MLQTSPLINKNNIKEKAHDYVHTSMVSHRGTPVSFAMREDDGKIFYSVLDLSSVKQQVNQISGDDANNDKFYWSNVNFDDDSMSCIHFPTELMQVGYAVVPNFTIHKYDKDNKKIIHSRDEDGKPLDKENHE